MDRKFDYSVALASKREAEAWAARYRITYPAEGYGTRTTVTECDTDKHPYGYRRGDWYVFASRFLTAE